MALNEDSNNTAYIPVSYTHLDVYKRQVQEGDCRAEDGFPLFVEEQ